MCGSIRNLHLPLSFMLLRTRSCPFCLPSGFFQKRWKMPSRVQACCERSSDAASTALEAKDWYSVSDRVTDCGCPISTGSGAEAVIFEGSPDGFGCGIAGDSRAVGVASLVDGCDSFCFLGAGVALGGRPGPRFSPVDSTIVVLFSSSRWSHVMCLEICRKVMSAE
jgi:hypothetical protein